MHQEPQKNIKPSSSKSAQTSSSQVAFSTIVYNDASRVRSLKKVARSTFFSDIRISVAQKINNLLPYRRREIVGKIGKNISTKKAEKGASRRPKNTEFGIYTSARRTQILNVS